MSASEFHLRRSTALTPEVPPDLSALYRDYAPWLIAFLRRRFGARDAEDLAQDTFANIALARAPIRNPRAYLARVALNTAGMQARRRLVRPVLVSDETYGAAVSDPAGQEQALLLKQTILALPPKLREVFLLSRVAGLTYEEIARRLGVSVKTVEARMSKALAECTALLD